MLGRTQCDHPGIGFPRTFEAFTVLINNHNIGNPFTQQAEGRTESALPASHNNDIIHMPFRMLQGTHPVCSAVGEIGKVGFHTFI
ncbi:hypothetical protein D3C81_1524670 [compost metagenome]